MRARGGATVLPTTDIFSFGVLAFQLLTNQLPFGTLETHNDLAEYQKRGKDGIWNRDALRHVNNSQQWIQLIEGCLNPDFRQRFQSVHDVLRLLPQSQGGGYQPQPVRLAQSYTPQQYASGYQLRILQGEEYGKVYQLTQLASQGRRILTIGRQLGNSIFIKSDFSDFLSRFHCTLELATNGHWAIRDGQWRNDLRQWVNSSNGTYVNSKPVNENGYFLKAGDIIAIGDVTLRFENY